MAKKNTNYNYRAEQLSLPLIASMSFNHPAGSFRRTDAVVEAIKTTLKRCFNRGMTRDHVADEMSRLLGEDVSKNHIANWAAESKNGYRLPLEWASVFSIVTNDNSVIKAAFEGSGINVLDDSEMAFYEIGKAVEEKRESDARLKENRNKLKNLKIKGEM